MVEDFKKANSLKKTFTVIEEFESLENDEFDPLLKNTYSIKGNPRSYKPSVPEGFELLPENKTFENDVLSIKYTRKRITLTFNPNGGEWDLTEDVHKLKGKYGERLPLIDIMQIEKVDSKFVGWTEDLDAETVTTVRIPEFYPAEDHTYYSIWDEVNSNYIVKIYEENLDYPEDATEDQKYTLVAMNAASGIPGEKSNYQAISRYGFIAERYDQVDIKGVDESSAVLKIFYNRRIFTYKFDLYTTKDVSSLAGKTVNYYNSSWSKLGSVEVESYDPVKKQLKLKSAPSSTTSIVYVGDTNLKFGTAQIQYSGKAKYSANYKAEYTNWDGGEPNDSCSGKSEQCMHFLSSGKWNDYAADYGSVYGYIVEFTPYENQWNTEKANYPSMKAQMTY